MLGVPDTQGTLTARVVRLVLRQACRTPIAYALGIGLFVLVATQATERLAKRLPGALLALTAVAVATAALHLELHGADVLGALPATLPRVALPTTKPTAMSCGYLHWRMISVALVCMMQTAAVLRAYPSHPEGPRHVARDFGGVGAGCLLSRADRRLPPSMPSPPRTAVAVSAGGGFPSRCCAGCGDTCHGPLFGGGGLLAFVPQAALGGILIAVALRIFRLNEIVNIARHGGSEIWLVAASILLVVGLPIETGMLASIVLSLLHSFCTVGATALPWSLPVRPAPPSGGRPKARLGDREPGVLRVRSRRAAELHRCGVHPWPAHGARSRRRARQCGWP